MAGQGRVTNLIGLFLRFLDPLHRLADSLWHGPIVRAHQDQTLRYEPKRAIARLPGERLSSYFIALSS